MHDMGGLHVDVILFNVHLALAVVGCVVTLHFAKQV